MYITARPQQSGTLPLTEVIIMQMPQPIQPPMPQIDPGETIPGEDTPPIPVSDPPSDTSTEPKPEPDPMRMAPGEMSQAGRTTLFAGTAAGITSVLALGWVACLEGKGVFQPLNSTSHWLNGERAAKCELAPRC